MAKTKAYIGIDPGKTGYICALAPSIGLIEFLPNIEKPEIIFNSILYTKSSFDVRMAMIEDVHSIYGASAKSTYNFGFNTGLIHGIVRSTGLGLDMIQPKIWQKYIGLVMPAVKKGAAPIAALRKNKIKQDVAAICERLYPQVNIRGNKGGIIDGKSDALMIAHYCSHKYR